MNFPLFVAKRYLATRRKKNFIHLISFLAIGGVAFSTAALIIVLSVFNGLENLLRSLNASFDAELKIEPATGKTFTVSDSLLQLLVQTPGVELVTEVIEDYAYVRYRDANQVVTLKGVSNNFLDQHRMDDKLVAGKLVLQEDGVPYALIGRGVQYNLSVAVDDRQYMLQLFYIKNTDRATTANPAALYARKSIFPGGVFSIVQQLDDNYVIVPLQVAVELMGMGNRRTSLELKLHPGAQVQKVQQQLRKRLGPSFRVLNREEQHRDLYRLLKVEKLFTFLSLSVLMAVSGINIFFILTMLALEKKRDLSVLAALGATPGLVRNIFLLEGVLIAAVGAITGLVLGTAVVALQHKFGFIGMGMQTAVTQGYPVKLVVTDVAAVMLIVATLTVLISWKPAEQASRLISVRNL
jgi:lipoprotein-releasing system permease protein